MKALTRKFHELEVVAFQNATLFSQVVSSIEKTILRVDGVHVCTTLCLDMELSIFVNAWLYDDIVKECKCGWIDHNDDTFSVQTPLEEEIGLKHAFVQASKLFPLGTTTIAHNAQFTTH